MKNFVIGFMISWWIRPVVNEVSHKLLVRLREELEKEEADD